MHFRKISGEEAARIIGNSPYEDYGIVGFDDVDAGRLGVKQGELISICPTDTGALSLIWKLIYVLLMIDVPRTGRIPTIGKLVGLNYEEVVIEVHGSTRDTVRCHFPRLNYTIRPIIKEDAKL